MGVVQSGDSQIGVYRPAFGEGASVLVSTPGGEVAIDLTKEKTRQVVEMLLAQIGEEP